MKKKNALRLLMVTVLLAAPAFSLAATASSPVMVSASVSQTCSITTTKELAFGAYDPVTTNVSTPVNATATLSVACSKSSSTTLSIGLSDGLYATSGQRAMQGGGTPLDKLNYDLFWPLAAGTCPGTTKWTNTTPGLFLIPAPPSKVARTYNVCGVIPAGQDVAVGTYNDTVTATINF